MTDKRQLKSKFTMEERIKIAQEFVSSNLSARIEREVWNPWQKCYSNMA